MAVVVSSPLDDWVSSLRAALDDRFVVSVGSPPARGIAIVETLEPAAVAALRRTATAAGLIVVVEGRRSGPVPTAELFDAGADVVLMTPDVRMLAAHVRALARRYG